MWQYANQLDSWPLVGLKISTHPVQNRITLSGQWFDRKLDATQITHKNKKVLLLLHGLVRILNLPRV